MPSRSALLDDDGEDDGDDDAVGETSLSSLSRASAVSQP